MMPGLQVPVQSEQRDDFLAKRIVLIGAWIAPAILVALTLLPPTGMPVSASRVAFGFGIFGFVATLAYVVVSPIAALIFWGQARRWSGTLLVAWLTQLISLTNFIWYVSSAD